MSRTVVGCKEWAVKEFSGAEMGDVRKLGRVGLRSLLFTVLLSGTSVVIGLVLVNTLAPGRQMAK